MTAGLDADLRLRRGSLQLELAFRVSPARTLAVLGPNGAGKTTALQALSGLVPLDAGHVRLDGRVLDDPAAGVLVAPEQRPVGVVFQDYLLFPHLNVLENVAFGLRAGGVPVRQARAAAYRWLDRMDLTAHAEQRPRRLSGGQQQRVALARALATEPDLLLLDEPLAALDARTRLQVRADLRHRLADYPGVVVLVTHDALDALLLADEIAVVEDGRLVQRGTPAEVARRPRTDYVARLVGLNLYRGQARRTEGQTVVRLAVGPSTASLVSADDAEGDVLCVVPPSAVGVHVDRPQGSARNAWPLRVAHVEPAGHRVRVHLVPRPTGEPGVELFADVTPAALGELRLAPGLDVWASVKATEVSAYPG